MTEAKITLSAVDKTAGAINTAKARLGDLATSAAGIGARFAGIGAALGGLLALDLVASQIAKTVNGLDALNDAADATGASIEKLSALEDVALRTGTGMDTVTSALVKLNGVLGDAKPGSPQEAALNAIGLSAKNLRNIDPADALQKVAVALAGYADDGNKARLVQELFGKSVKEVAPLLKDLAEKGQLNATVTAEQARAAEDFNKNLAVLQKNATDAARSLVQDLVPALNRLFDRKKEGGIGAVLGFDNLDRLQAQAKVVANSQAMVGLQIERFTNLAKIGVSGAQAQVDKLRGQAAQLSKDSLAISEQIKRATNPGGDLNEDYGNEGRRAKATIKPGVAIVAPDTKLYDAYVDRLREGLRATQELSIAEQLRVDLAEGRLGALNGAQRDYLEQLAGIADIEKDRAKQKGAFVGPEIDPAAMRAYEDVQATIAASVGAQTEVLAAKAMALGEAFNSGAIGATDYSRGIDVVTERLKGLQPKLEETSEFAAQAARNIQDALGDGVLSALEGNFDSIGKSWAALLKRMVAQAAAAQISNYLLGDGFAKTGNVGGALGGAVDWLKGLGGARAAGGPVQAGVPYLVGERGPEIVVPRSNGTVLPNGVGLPAGGNIFQTFVQGEVAAKTMRAIRNAQADQEMRLMRRAGG